MSDPEKIRVKPLKDFTDAGSERSFTKGKSVSISRGEAENYAAAGLIPPLPPVQEAEETADEGDATPGDAAVA